MTRKDREVAAEGADPLLVSVQVFPLTRPYRPALFTKASRELDRVAGELAGGLKGKVTAARTVTIGRARARQYEVRYRDQPSYGDLVQQITFVLSDRREYQLLCRRPARANDAPCAALAASFKVA